jgi:nicotinamide-nucleotide amidase
MQTNHQVELIAIGDELLNGLRLNSHLVYLGEQLERNGLPLTWAAELRDEPQEIVEALQTACSRSDLVLVTGGLGPTEDDFTAACAANALGRLLVNHPGVEAAIREFFQKRGREPTGNNFKQAEIIEGAEIIENENGTAPGQWIESDGTLIVLLPGPPRELIPMFEGAVLTRLKERGWASEALRPLQLRTLGLGESAVADRLQPFLEDHASTVRVAYCAHLYYVDVRLSPISRDLPEESLKAIGETCRERLGEGFLGYGTPDVACIILQQLRGLNKTLAVAESCTGGLLASRFTDIAGASKVFKGGIICYNNEVKENILGVPNSILEQHGAVSSECAVAMATAVAELMESDYALAITGYAGPEGGTEPAGTVYIGYHSPLGIWSHKAVLPGKRTDVKERAAITALDFLRRKLDKYRMFDLLESLKC